jgi:glucose/mannose transport system substrate-binding protein
MVPTTFPDDAPPRSGSLCSRRAFVLAMTALGGAHAAPAVPDAGGLNGSLQVLHWWTSLSERRAAEVLAAGAHRSGMRWIDAAVPGGAGIGAGKVLRSRVLSGDTPDVTQLIGTALQDWADAGLLLQLDSVAAAGKWSQSLLPTVFRHVEYRGHVIAAPIGLHRVNLMFSNRRVLAEAGVQPASSWEQWSAQAEVLRRRGISPLALSSEAWQVTTLFESLLLGTGGADLYAALLVRHEPAAAADARLTEALRRLRVIKSWHVGKVTERNWTETLAAMKEGRAASTITGDWAKGELQGAGWQLGAEFDCQAAPDTESTHLYSIDTLAMLTKDYAKSPLQERLAALLVTPALQAEYNRTKGSVPVFARLDAASLDACARESWQLFSRGDGVQVPSLTHRMATDEAIKEVLMVELHRYFIDDAIAAQTVQRRLGSMFKILRRPGDGARRAGAALPWAAPG